MELQMKKNKPKNQDTENKIPQKAPESDPYRKKIINLKKRIIFGLSTLFITLIVIFAFNFYDKKANENNAEQISTIEAQINDLRTKSAGTEAKINDAKKFKRLWTNASDKKKNFNGIKVADITDDFNSMAEKEDISKPLITLSVPEVLKNTTYQLETIDVNLINCTMNFEALTDRAALDFINNFISKLPGYVVINELSIKKTKKEGYSDQDLIDISNGKFPSLISSKVSFSWYFLKRKPKQIKSPNNAN